MIFTPNGFLKFAGVAMIIASLMDFIGVMFLPMGAIALIAAFTFNAGMQRWLVSIIGCVSLISALYNHSIIQGVIVVWACIAVIRKPRMISETLHV